MDKFSELKAAAMAATPGPWFRSSVQFNGITTEETFITQGNKPHLANASEKRDAIFIAAANPAVVLDLLAELEAKDQALKNVTELWKDANATAFERIRELRAKLATPVRLPPLIDGELFGKNSATANAHNNAIAACSIAIRGAGFKSEATVFKCEGDE